MKTLKIGIIGGSGLYQLDALENPQWHEVSTPWGDPSDALLTGRIAGIKCVFLPRHGRGHVLGPTQLNYRANIDALKRLGVTDLVSISAVGSLSENMAPGEVVVVDQFIDRTFARKSSFSAKAWSRMSPWLTRFARACPHAWPRLRRSQGRRCSMVAPISRLKGHNSRPVPKAYSSSNGVPT